MPVASLSVVNVVPQPAEATALDGSFLFTRAAPVTAVAAANGAARHLRQQLGDPVSAVGSVSVRLRNAPSDQGPEGYQLAVMPDGMTIDASAPAGWFYGVQTLLQLLPPDATAPRSRTSAWRLPCVRIVDTPRFRWRGLMLDVARHVMPVDGILRLLDTMAAHKLNTFHWHLTDDQGWRIESHRYPQLTAVGAVRAGADGVLTPDRAVAEPRRTGTYGGFYTHDDVRRVVAHAAERHVRVVPEIEMPGHAVAALAAYPEFSCSGGPFAPATRTGIFKDVYCVGNEGAMRMLEGVLDEILPLFPGAYVHVGGDECPTDRWRACPRCQARVQQQGLASEHDLQGYVIRRMARFLGARGKRLVGWDEILDAGDLPADATVMSWRGTAGGTAAARAGHDVVMTPHPYCYLDYRQALTDEPTAIADGFTPLDKTYRYEPVPPELTAEQAEHIIGVQGNVWTEYMPDMRHVEYMVWPRAAAIAEVGWSPADARDFDDFARRVVSNEVRLAHRGSAFRPVRDDRE
jgi:hexosaminidase